LPFYAIGAILRSQFEIPAPVSCRTENTEYDNKLLSRFGGQQF